MRQLSRFTAVAAAACLATAALVVQAQSSSGSATGANSGPTTTTTTNPGTVNTPSTGDPASGTGMTEGSTSRMRAARADRN